METEEDDEAREEEVEGEEASEDRKWAKGERKTEKAAKVYLFFQDVEQQKRVMSKKKKAHGKKID